MNAVHIAAVQDGSVVAVTLTPYAGRSGARVYGQATVLNLSPETARSLGVMLIGEAAGADCWSREVGARAKAAGREGAGE